MAGNREYKSDVFSMLMEDPDNALSLYNAINGSSYTNPEMVEMCRLDKGISLSVRNDAAFVLDSNLSLYEHQSTICPNMPIRNLIYFTNIAEQMIKKRNIYGRSLIRIPTPKFAVFYNGDEQQPEQYDMRLSDAFTRQTDNPQLELKCRVYNINHGKNTALLEQCPMLKGYMTFVDYVRYYHKEHDYDNLELAIDRAINRCISENVLKDFFESNRSEVIKVTDMDYTFEKQLTLERAEAIEEGLEQGLEQGRKQERCHSIQFLVETCQEIGISLDDTIRKLSEKYNFSLEEAAQETAKYWK